jgi:hypothetical protein
LCGGEEVDARRVRMGRKQGLIGGGKHCTR